MVFGNISGEYRTVYHKKMGYTVIHREKTVNFFKNLVKVNTIFFAILEDSDIPPTKCTETREILPECFRDFNLIEEEAIYICHKSQNCKPQGKRKRFLKLQVLK